MKRFGMALILWVLLAFAYWLAFGGNPRPPEPAHGVTFDVRAPRPRVVPGPLAVN